MTSAWEESQTLVMRLLEDNARDLREIKSLMTTEFKEVRKELRDALDGHKKEHDQEIDELKKQLACQNTEIALLKQRFVLIGGGSGAVVAIIAEIVRTALAHH